MINILYAYIYIIYITCIYVCLFVYLCMSVNKGNTGLMRSITNDATRMTTVTSGILFSAPKTLIAFICFIRDFGHVFLEAPLASCLTYFIGRLKVVNCFLQNVCYKCLT